jgi:predicted RNase H-like HicB family nuclease
LNESCGKLLVRELPSEKVVTEMTQTDALTGVITVEQRIVRKVLTTDPPLTFTITVEYVPEDNGFGAWCEEMEAAGWGETLEEALNELAEEMWDFAEVLVEDHDNDPTLRDPRIIHARYLLSLGSLEKVKRLVGL